MANYVAQTTIKQMINNNINVSQAKVGILGVTFKENCPDIRNSKVVNMIHEFEKWGVDVVVADPWADAEEVHKEYGLKLSTIDAQNPVDTLVVAVGHKEFRNLDAKTLRSFVRTDKPVLADVKSLFDRHNLADQGFSVFRL